MRFVLLPASIVQDLQALLVLDGQHGGQSDPVLDLPDHGHIAHPSLEEVACRSADGRELVFPCGGVDDGRRLHQRRGGGDEGVALGLGEKAAEELGAGLPGEVDRFPGGVDAARAVSCGVAGEGRGVGGEG